MGRLYRAHTSSSNSQFSSSCAHLVQHVTLSLSSCTTSCAQYLKTEGPCSRACRSRCGLLCSGYPSSAFRSSSFKSLGCCENMAWVVQRICSRGRYTLVCISKKKIVLFLLIPFLPPK